MNNKKFFLAILLAILLLTSCDLVEKIEEENSIPVSETEKEIEETEKTEKTEEVEEKEPRIEEIRIKAFGDIMFHMPQIRYASNPDGTYNFSESFSEVKDFIQDADLSIGNFESTSHPDRSLGGFPMFNTPRDVFKDLKEAGFDILSTINNHSLDTGISGVISTIEGIEESGLKNFGTYKPGEREYLIVDIKDIKVGILGYTESLNGMNGLLDTEEKKEMVNLLIEENVQRDIENLKENCDFLIIYPHWGVEYNSQMSSKQIEMAHKMAEWGADAIIGNHPHVVQPTEKYETKDGRESFIVYSCGNFLSNQRKETMDMEPALQIENSERCEQNISFEIILQKNFDENKSKIKDVIYHPMWVGLREGEKGRRVVKSHLCREFLEGGKKFEEVEDYTRNRIKDAYVKTLATTGDSYNPNIDSATFEDIKVEILSQREDYGDEIKISKGEEVFILNVEGMNPWRVDFCNVDGNEPELAIGVYKSTPLFDEVKNRVFLYNIDFENKRLKPKLRISRLSNPLVDYDLIDLDGNGLDEIVSIEERIDGSYVLGGYKWTNFAVEKVYESEALASPPKFNIQRKTVELEGVEYTLFLEGEAIRWK